MTKKQKTIIKDRLRNGESVDLENNESCFIIFNGYNGRFCLEMNAKIIKSTKTLKTIFDKLEKEGAEILPFQ